MGKKGILEQIHISYVEMLLSLCLTYRMDRLIKVKNTLVKLILSSKQIKQKRLTKLLFVFTVALTTCSLMQRRLQVNRSVIDN